MTPPFKGEAQGTFRRVPHPPPLKPLSATPPSGSLAECGSRSLPFRQAFLCKENVVVLVSVSPQRFLIIGLLKTDNSLTLKQSVLLTQPSIINLFPIKEKLNLGVPKFTRLVWISPNIAKLVFIFKQRRKNHKTVYFKIPSIR